VQPEPIDFDDHDGWTQIFDGKTLNGWDGPPRFGGSKMVPSSANPHRSIPRDTNIIWRGGEPGNFMLKVEMKLEVPEPMAASSIAA